MTSRLLVAMQFALMALVVLRASAEEAAEHRRVLDQIAQESKGTPVWTAGTAA